MNINNRNVKQSASLAVCLISVLLFQNFAPNNELATMSAAEICKAQKNGLLPENAVDITSLGADPTGRLDSYEAFVTASRFISNKNDNVHRVLVLPAGIYLIDKFVDGVFKTFATRISEARKNGTSLPIEDTKLGDHIVFEKASNFRIIGCDAVISVKGNFYRGNTNRTAMVSGKPYYFPERSGLTPFMFKDNKNFGVYGYSEKGKYGLELNGNVNQMSRDTLKPQLESTGIGISTAGCYNYTLKNIDIHHFSVDGITIGSGGTAAVKKNADKTYSYVLTDYNGTIENIRSTNNGRQGMSVISVRKLTVRDSQFSNTGRTGLNNQVNLKFPGYSPQAGVDVEPNFSTTPVEYSKNNFILQDYQTQDIRFYSSRFENNIGIQFVAGTNKIYGLYLYDPVVESTYSGDKASAHYPNSQIYTMWLEGRVVRIYRGKITTHTGAIYAAAKEFSDVALQSVEITTSGSGLMSVGKGRIVLLNSTITQEEELMGKSPPRYLPYIQNKNVNSLVGRNRFFYSKDFVTNKFQVAGLIQGISHSDSSRYKVWGNRFETDYQGDAKLMLSYTGSKIGVGTKTSGDVYPQANFLMPDLKDGEFEDGYFKTISSNAQAQTQKEKAP